eukprot:CAMPEP_0202827704 /NCGR_PEP_ID=MMETSP1389-20130828/14457_1 /ASSEMBLY_ACC=CAM_ASM_000865 /TAXON_ID=302021 /ORGANISM="Rhodomonas sp., Strain CCMP768" /LENGTH=212 /DNA_ID=CAMNT_0049501135 /DNA_START=66 /DNA_END=705 /DNA_ORIENTATION=+
MPPEILEASPPLQTKLQHLEPPCFNQAPRARAERRILCLDHFEGGHGSHEAAGRAVRYVNDAVETKKLERTAGMAQLNQDRIIDGETPAQIQGFKNRMFSQPVKQAKKVEGAQLAACEDEGSNVLQARLRENQIHFFACHLPFERSKRNVHPQVMALSNQFSPAPRYSCELTQNAHGKFRDKSTLKRTSDWSADSAILELLEELDADIALLD